MIGATEPDDAVTCNVLNGVDPRSARCARQSRTNHLDFLPHILCRVQDTAKSGCATAPERKIVFVRNPPKRTTAGISGVACSTQSNFSKLTKVKTIAADRQRSNVLVLPGFQADLASRERRRWWLWLAWLANRFSIGIVPPHGGVLQQDRIKMPRSPPLATGESGCTRATT